MNMNIKTKLTYGIGLLFVLITLLGGLAIKNIHNVSDDTQNILADNYNSLLYSRQSSAGFGRKRNETEGFLHLFAEICSNDFPRRFNHADTNSRLDKIFILNID